LSYRLSVRHRIDGLENFTQATTHRQKVRHRIDGLENCHFASKTQKHVRHRIDGLETIACAELCFLLRSPSHRWFRKFARQNQKELTGSPSHRWFRKL